MIAQSDNSATNLRPSVVERQTLAPHEAARRMEELSRIILAYSEVTERLERSQEQLRQTVELLRDELSEKNRLLERKNRLAALGEMAAGLAHEIRNPLGGIQLYASMLARDLADREEPLRTVQKISAGVRRVEALVGQVLQFSREIAIHPRPIDLAQVVSQAVEDARKTIDEHRVSCQVEGAVSLPARADPLMLGQAILNLILNAAEAMPPDGRIFVSYGGPPEESDAKQFHIIVRDTGPGIPPAILDRIFNPFFTTKDSGTGLGLAIVHRVIEAHDGTITASNGSAGGARFEIRI